MFENRELKAEVTQEAEPMLAPGGFFASNTSTLPITGLATASARPEKFVGIHFFSPVDKMKLVEIIRGRQTDDETVARAFDYVHALGKMPIVVNDSRGFFTSRVFGTFVMEGAAMLGEGIPAPLVEQAALAGGHAGRPAGGARRNLAVALGPRAGPDARRLRAPKAGTYIAVARRIAGRADGQGVRPQRPRGRRRLLRLSRKGATKFLWPESGSALREAPASRADIDDAEAAAALPPVDRDGALPGRRRADQRADANIGSIFGIGFPAWTGGAMQFIASEGTRALPRQRRRARRRHGERFALRRVTRASGLPCSPKTPRGGAIGQRDPLT